MIQPNDVVEATLIDPDTQNAVTQLFTVTSVDGTAYAGGQFPVDTETGWTVRLSRKDPANLGLPTVLSEVIMFDRSNIAHQVIGKNYTWRDESGALVDLTDIFGWTEVSEEE
jgi:hypothetical protein